MQEPSLLKMICLSPGSVSLPGVSMMVHVPIRRASLSFLLRSGASCWHEDNPIPNIIRKVQILSVNKFFIIVCSLLCKFHHPGGKRLFYTEGNNHLFIFVYGKGAKVSNWTYDDYYQIEGEKLYLWSSKEDMNARKYESAITYIRKPNS